MSADQGRAAEVVSETRWALLRLDCGCRLAVEEPDDVPPYAAGEGLFCENDDEHGLVDIVEVTRGI